MNRWTLAAVLGASLAGSAQAADVGVTLQFSQPGVYGRVDIGQFPQPQLVAPQPVLIAPPPAAMTAPPPEPVYLWVPEEHRHNWARHCREYHACGRPVYFVDHDWYQRNVMARAHERGEHHAQARREQADERGRGREREHADEREADREHGH